MPSSLKTIKERKAREREYSSVFALPGLQCSNLADNYAVGCSSPTVPGIVPLSPSWSILADRTGQFWSYLL